MSDRKFDQAVERAVREMLDVEPPADLRARVVFQIERRASNPVASGFSLNLRNAWIPIAVAVAAILLVVRVAWHPQPPVAPVTVARDEPRPAAQPPSQPSQPSAAETAGPQTATARISAPVARSTTDGARVFAASVPPPPDTSTTEIEPLRSIAPIQLTPIIQSSVAPEEIAMRPLRPIADLQIAPLSPPDRRN